MIVVVTSTVLTQIDSVSASERAAKSMELLTKQASANEAQASAARDMAMMTRKELDGVQSQIDEMKGQSKSLASSSIAANGQLLETSRYNRLSFRPFVSFQRDYKDGGEVGLYLTNYGIGPASIKNERIYFDSKRIDGISEVGLPEGIFNGTVYFSDYRHGRTIPAGAKVPLYWTNRDQIDDLDGFRELITKRIFIIASACSIYEECKTICNDVSASSCAEVENKLRKTPPVKRAGREIS